MKQQEGYEWFPVYTLPRSEKKTFTTLKAKGFEVYLPLRKTLKQWSDRKKWVEEPLFPSYIFVYINAAEYDKILHVQGVVRFIYFSGKAAIVPLKQMNLLKNYLEGHSNPEIALEALAKGQRVKIISGKFTGMEAELVSYKKQQRLILRMEALGQSLLLDIRADEVIPLTENY